MLLFERLHDDAIIPRRATKGSAAYDLFMLETIELDSSNGSKLATIAIENDKPIRIRTGVKVNMPAGHCGQFWARSSHGSKGVIITGGFIDPDYPDELVVMLAATAYDPVEVKKGEKIGQMAIVPVYIDPDEEEVTAVRTGGFGSTGK